jgi:hypothetical protein
MRTTSNSTSKQNGSRKWHGRTSTGKAVDFTPVVSAFRDISNWALDVAGREVAEYPEEVERVENARAFILAGLAGQPIDLPEPDILVTLGVLITAFDVHCGVPGLVDAVDATLSDILAGPTSRRFGAGCPYAARRARASGHGYLPPPTGSLTRDQFVAALEREIARRGLQK